MIAINALMERKLAKARLLTANVFAMSWNGRGETRRIAAISIMMWRMRRTDSDFVSHASVCSA